MSLPFILISIIQLATRMSYRKQSQFVFQGNTCGILCNLAVSLLKACFVGFIKSVSRRKCDFILLCPGADKRRGIRRDGKSLASVRDGLAALCCVAPTFIFLKCLTLDRPRQRGSRLHGYPSRNVRQWPE